MFSWFKKVIGVVSNDQIIEKGAVIVDVRSKNEFSSGHIAGAVNIPLEQIGMHATELTSYPQVVVYCRSGNRSAHAKRILKENGISHVIDAGSLSSVQSLAGATGLIKEELIKEDLGLVKKSSPVVKDQKVLKVLIPTDFSVQAEYSFIMVRKLEENMSLEIHFLHVMDMPETVTLDGNGDIATCGEIDISYVKDQKRIIERKLNNLKTLYGDHVKVHMILGKVTDSIIKFAESENFDLIVMGTKGSWGLKEKLTSSQAQIISRKAKVPVLSLMCDRSDLIIKDILYVHDFKEAETLHLPLMNKFAGCFDAVYHQLYIAPENQETTESEILSKMDIYAINHNLSKHLNHIVYAAGVEDGVNKFLARQDIDMIFIGTHGQGGLFYNSGAESLVKHLFKPIISFHLN